MSDIDAEFAAMSATLTRNTLRAQLVLEATVIAILDMHDDGGDTCSECGQEAPCRTQRAITDRMPMVEEGGL